MGFFDSIKKSVGDVAQKAQQAAQQAVQPQAQQPWQQPPQQHFQQPQQHEEVEEESVDEDERFDLAGFDPNDEDAFFEAQRHMESEGQFGGTDESRAQIMQRYGIRSRMHWQGVKSSVYHVLAQRHGSLEAVMQRQMNYEQKKMQQHMMGQVQAQAAGGGFAPVEGITLEAWAATNAAIVQGANLDDLLKGSGVDKARWDRARVEWEARMARDTTFAIAQVYGAAFQAASTGKYAALSREANAARAENRDLQVPAPMSLEQYYDIMYEQAYGAKQGKDPVAVLKSMGLSIVDWTDLSTYMGYLFYRTAGLKQKEYEALHQKMEAKYKAKYPNAGDVDIAF